MRVLSATSLSMLDQSLAKPDCGRGPASVAEAREVYLRIPPLTVRSSPVPIVDALREIQDGTDDFTDIGHALLNVALGQHRQRAGLVFFRDGDHLVANDRDRGH
jgi:hypothetical protein